MSISGDGLQHAGWAAQPTIPTYAMLSSNLQRHIVGLGPPIKQMANPMANSESFVNQSSVGSLPSRVLSLDT